MGSLEYVEVLKDGINGVDGLNHVMSATISPDGNNVYVASYHESHSVAVFSRDPDDNGKLSFIHRLKDGVGGVDGLNGAWYVTISTDGKNVYVAGTSENAVAVFSRDADDSGKLSFVHRLKDGIGGVDGLGSARSLTVSPDGLNMYVASYEDDAVAVFSRDAGDSGKLSFVHRLKDGVGGVYGLDGARGVTISPDGRNVYVASSNSNAVAVFSRDADDSGKLSFVHRLKDGVGGVDGLRGTFRDC